MKRKAKLFVAAIAFAIFLSGCASSYEAYLPPKKSAKRQPRIEIVAGAARIPLMNADESEAEIIRSALNHSAPLLQGAITSITIYTSTPDKMPEWAAADCNGKGEMRILANHIYPQTIWHEAQHALDFKMLAPKKLRDDEEWISISGKKAYDEINQIRESSDYPREGILSIYGATNCAEDKAVWVECIYGYCFTSSKVNPFYGIDRSDERYLKKLDLLLRRGSITEKMYKKIAPLLKK